MGLICLKASSAIWNDPAWNGPTAGGRSRRSLLETGGRFGGPISLVVLAFYHPFLLAFDVVLLAAIAFVVLVLGRNAVSTAIAESKAKYAVAAWLEEIARNMWAFKLNEGPELARLRADDLAHIYLAARGSHFRVLLRQVVGAVSLHADVDAARRCPGPRDPRGDRLSGVPHRSGLRDGHAARV